MAFPEDTQFEETTVDEVTKQEGGWTVKRGDGWSFFVSNEHGVEPKVGQTMRFYGRGIGSPVRGLYLDGQCVWYYTEAEYKVKSDQDIYGKSAQEWLDRWDKDQSVHTVTMGGLGPAYEQCIQITVAETLRFLLARNYDATKWESDESLWKEAKEEIERHSFDNPIIQKLGLSGAQWGAAFNLALNLYRRGPIAALTDPKVKDRGIMVSRRFPDPYGD